MSGLTESEKPELTRSQLQNIIDDLVWKCNEAKKRNRYSTLSEQKRLLHYYRRKYEKLTGEWYGVI